MAVSVENADVWQGKLRYGIAGQAPPGGTIDPQSGQFSWTPLRDQPAGPYGVTVSVAGPDGRSDETSFVVNVLRPIPLLRLKPIPAQTVEAGKPLKLTLRLENPEVWQGYVHYGIDEPAPPGAVVDRQSGEFSWTPPEDGTGRVEISLFAVSREGQTTRARLAITVTRRRRGVPKVFSVEQLRAIPGCGAIPDSNGTRGQRWIVLTGLVPYKKQLAEYHARFDGAAWNDPNEDVPKYVGYFVQRADVVPGREPRWSKFMIFDANEAAKMGGQLAEEPADPRFVRKGLTSPLPLLVDTTWGAEAVSPPQIPLIKRRADKDQGSQAPEYLLLRFLDYDVKPNQKYQYRIFLALLNPNNKLETNVLEEPELAESRLIGIKPITNEKGEIVDWPTDPKYAQWSPPCTARRAGRLAVARWAGRSRQGSRNQRRGSCPALAGAVRT